MDTTIVRQRESLYKFKTNKFSLYIALGSIVMMFTAFTSAYIVRQSAGNWLEFPLPDLFFVSTAVIVLSSITLHMSYHFFKQSKEQLYKFLLILSAALGVAFVFTQYYAWMEMFQMGIDLKRNPSGAFVYVISGAHAAHVLGGIATFLVALIHAFFLPFKVTEKRKNRFQLVLIYWHFVDFLWIYLLLFFSLQR